MFSKRALTAVWIAAATLAGFGLKLYPGPGSDWPNNYGAGVLYEVFWILIFYFACPSALLVKGAPVLVFILTSAFEFLQLSHAPVLENIRSTFLGRTLIGTDFVWLDFPHYFLGCFLGFLLVKRIHGRN